MKRIVLLCAVLWVSLLVSGCGAMQAKQIDPISVETAKALALKAVGLTTEQVSFTTVDLETQGGLDYYAVRFTAGGRSYSYEIDALSGVVIDGQPDYDESAAGQQEAQTSPGESLVTDADSFGSVPTQTQPGGTQEGNADAVSSATVQQEAQTSPGESLVTDADSFGSVPTQTQPGGTQEGNADAVSSATVQQQSPAPSGNGDMISAEEARGSALAHAGLSAEQVTFVKSKLDWDHGRQMYEIEFYTADGKEYDYEVDPYTGEILSFDYDAEQYAPSAGGSGGTITADEAKARALAQVPGATSEHIVEFAMDREDGRLEYEGKIRYGGVEYEFEIDGYSGAIRSWEAEAIHR